ncbi:MAG: glycosyltransferase [Xanthomonadales bacterium]|nr:glycosyltransferase [Xanthomonadales bacterium]
MTPRVSVVLPVRDGGRFLKEAVSSILGQSLTELELLLVDDHSNDGAVSALQGRDPRLRVLDSRGRGVSAAFNTGLAAAGGGFVARMDADDIANADRLEKQLRYLDLHPEIAICGACVEIFSDTGVGGGNARYQSWLNACRTPGQIQRELFIESPIPNPTAFFRREAIERLGGYGDPDWPEDYDLYLRADALGLKMGKPDDVLLRWRDHGGRLTRTDPRYALERFQAAKARFLARGRVPPGAQVLIWGAGPTGRLMHDLLRKEGVDIRGFLEVHPRRIGGEKRGLPVWHFEQLAEFGDAFVLVAVGAVGARDKIRGYMRRIGREEGADYLFVA